MDLASNLVPNPCCIQRNGAGSSGVSPSSRTFIGCIFCSETLSQGDLNELDDSSQKYSKMVKALFYNFLLNPKEVPQDCNPMSFPFCKVCKTHVKKIYQEQCIIKQAQDRISETVSHIERVVVDTLEVLKSNPIKLENSGAKKLTDKILEGYRNNLLMKRKLRQCLNRGESFGKILGKPTCSPFVVLKDDEIRKHFAKARIKESSSDLGIDSIGNDAVNDCDSYPEPELNMTVDVSPGDIFSGLDLETESESNKEVKQSPQNVCTSIPGVEAYYNESTCSMVISGVRSEASSSNENESETTPSEHPVAGPSKISNLKKEFRNAQASSKGNSLGSFRRVRRSIFRGTKIYRISYPNGTSSLQCGTCNHQVPMLQRCEPGSSPHDMITKHILENHLGQKKGRMVKNGVEMPTLENTAEADALSTSSSAFLAPPVLQVQSSPASPVPSSSSFGLKLGRRGRKRRPYQFCCSHCNEKFPGKRLLREHNFIVHEIIGKAGNLAYKNPLTPYQQICKIFECDICQRPVRGNYQNLMTHKFSHKNDEERKEAIAANEMGARLNRLSRAGIHLNKKTPIKNTTGTRRCRRKYTKQALNCTRGSNLEKNLPCQLCDKKFLYKNHLSLHMKWSHSQYVKKSSVTQETQEHLTTPQKAPNTEKPRPVKCPLCPRTFERKNHLGFHMKGSHSKRTKGTPTVVSNHQASSPTYAQVVVRVPVQRLIGYNKESAESIYEEEQTNCLRKDSVNLEQRNSIESRNESGESSMDETE